MVGLNDNYLLFFQMAEFAIVSKTPFLTIKIADIIAFIQKNREIHLYESDPNIDFTCNFFSLMTYDNRYDLMVQDGKIHSFIYEIILKNRKFSGFR